MVMVMFSGSPVEMPWISKVHTLIWNWYNGMEGGTALAEALFGKIFHNFGFRLLGVALGSIVYYFVLQIVIWLGIDTDLLKLLSAAVVAVFLAIPYWQSKYFSRPVKRGGDR